MMPPRVRAFADLEIETRGRRFQLTGSGASIVLRASRWRDALFLARDVISQPQTRGLVGAIDKHCRALGLTLSLAVGRTRLASVGMKRTPPALDMALSRAER